MERESSIVDLLRADLQQIASNKDVYIKVPGYEKSGIQIRYRMPENSKELSEIATKVEKQTKDRFSRNLYTIMDTIIALCDGVYCQPGTDNPEPLDLEEDGDGIAPLLSDPKLAGYLGMNGVEGEAAPTARIVLKKLFGDNEFAIISHGEKLQRWLVDQNADVNTEFWQLGE